MEKNSLYGVCIVRQNWPKRTCARLLLSNSIQVHEVLADFTRESEDLLQLQDHGELSLELYEVRTL